MTKMTFSMSQKIAISSIFAKKIQRWRFSLCTSFNTASSSAPQVSLCRMMLRQHSGITKISRQFFSQKFSRRENVYDNRPTFLKITELFLFFSRKIFMKDIKSFTKAFKLWRWVAQSGRWVAKSGRWVAKSGRRVAKLVARMLIWQLSGFESRHLLKI